jgi:D-glycero-D-manno-heptose 1,7-bisphosphate phosphatase
MFAKAAADLDIAFDRSWMIGDKIIDMDAGRSAGTNTIMVLTGHGTIEAKAASSDQLVVPDVLQAVRVLLS